MEYTLNIALTGKSTKENGYTKWKSNTKVKTLTFVLGLRPVANMMWEKPSTVPFLVFKDREPSADL